MPLTDQVAIITGGAGGIGRATARLMVGAGATVAVVDRDLERATEVAEELRALGRVEPIRADVSVESDVKAAVARTMDLFGRIDILFNNAGIGSSSAAIRGLLDTSEELWDRVLAINLKSVALNCKHVIPIMAKAGKGAIINNSSISALIGTGNADAYSAAKAGVVALTRSLGVDWGRHGIRVNCVCPGAVDTPMFDAASAEMMASVMKYSVMGRIARADEIAQTVLFLASDAASHINGAIIPVDGGRSAR